jgi:hypothetical protein
MAVGVEAGPGEELLDRGASALAGNVPLRADYPFHHGRRRESGARKPWIRERSGCDAVLRVPGIGVVQRSVLLTFQQALGASRAEVPELGRLLSRVGAGVNRRSAVLDQRPVGGIGVTRLPISVVGTEESHVDPAALRRVPGVSHRLRPVLVVAGNDVELVREQRTRVLIGVSVGLIADVVTVLL